MELNLLYSDFAGPYIALAGISFLSLLAAVRRKRRLSLLADPALISKTWLPDEAALRRSRTELLFWFLIGAALTAALLRPQWGYVWRDTTRRGIDLVVAVDVSDSMMSADVPPSRLSRARYKVRDLLEHLQGDRVGLVAFAGTAFIESPLTVDYGTFRLFLDSLSPELIPIQGTNIEAALEKSLEVLGYKSLDGPPEANAAAKSQAILLITDGEDFEGSFEAVGEFAAAQGVQIYIIGIGTKEGGPIPVGKGFKKDNGGKMVVTRLDEKKLIGLAKQTGGIYVEAIGSDDDITTIYDRGIKNFLESRSIDGGRLRLWNERYQLPLLAAVTLLLFGPWGGIAASISRMRNKDSKNRRHRSGAENSAAVLIPFITVLSSTMLASPPDAFARDAEQDGFQGKQALIAGDFAGAERMFTEGLAADSADPRLLLGLGESYYRLGRFNEAADVFKRAAESVSKIKPDSAAGSLRALAQYNLGNTLVQLGKLKEAIISYESALKSRPRDQEIIDNLAYARRLSVKPDQQKKSEEKKQEKKEAEKEKNDEKKPDEKDHGQKNQDQNQNQPENQPSNQQPNEKPDQQKDQQKDRQQDQQNRNNEQQNDQQKPGEKGKQEEKKEDNGRQQKEQQSGDKDQPQKDQSSGKNTEQPEGSDQQKQQQPEPQDGDTRSQKDQNQDQDQPQSGAKKQGDQSDGAEQQPSSGSAESAAGGESSGSQGEKQGVRSNQNQGSQPGGDPKDINGEGKTGSTDPGSTAAKNPGTASESTADSGQNRSEDGKGESLPQGNKEDGGTGQKGSEAGTADIGAGDRSGEGGDAPGSDEEKNQPGEVPKAEDTSTPSRMKSQGQKSENNGIELNQDEYASPQGEDLGQSGGEGAKDRLAQKEQPGDHPGLNGIESSAGGSGGGKDGPGSAKAEVESFLDNVGEERGLYLKYREKKGQQQLRSEGRAAPEKDW